MNLSSAASTPGGFQLTCGVLGDGELRCWGQSAVVNNEPPGSYRQVESAEGVACALDHAGAIVCWGTAFDASPPSATYLALAAGPHHFCGLRPDLEIECWGQ